MFFGLLYAADMHQSNDVGANKFTSGGGGVRDSFVTKVRIPYTYT